MLSMARLCLADVAKVWTGNTQMLQPRTNAYTLFFFFKDSAYKTKYKLKWIEMFYLCCWLLVKHRSLYGLSCLKAGWAQYDGSLLFKQVSWICCMCHSEPWATSTLDWFSYTLLTLLPSMPDVADLLETCVDDLIRTPVPMATAGSSEEAGPRVALSTPSAVTENLSLTGETRTHAQKKKNIYMLALSGLSPFN